MRLTLNYDDIPMLNIRLGSFTIDDESFPQGIQLARAGLAFNIDQLTATIDAMISDGESVEDRIIFVAKRRRAFQLLEILDGVIYSLPMEEDGVSLVVLNNHQLSKHMVDVLRQSLLILKNFKVRDSTSVQLIDKMVSYMLYGKEEALARADEAAQKS
jgi:hypothetical protein